MSTRRGFLKITALTGAGFWLGPALMHGGRVLAQIPGGSLPPGDVDKYVVPLTKPPAMPAKALLRRKDKYDIAVRQFTQQVLSPPLPATTVWSYGAVNQPSTVLDGGSFNFPALTIEATWNKTVQVHWRNQLVDELGNYLPHLLPVDQTLHWANPPGGVAGRDGRGTEQGPYTGPVPIVTHVHGAHTRQEHDGYAEAWYLPDAHDIPPGHARTGTFFDFFNETYDLGWDPGTASFKYPNDQRATTLWYHDHTLGLTRLNVYAGPAGFYLIRGGPDDLDLGYTAPILGDSPLGEYTEIPIAIQDRSFNDDGSFFYPDNRAFFEGLDPGQLQIPYFPDTACNGDTSDVAPIWNPEFFGNVMVVNGVTWPYLEVEQRRYRFRLLNGCNSRFLVLRLDNGMPFYQIGADGGFLPEPVQLNELLMSPAERVDVVVDFTHVPVCTEIMLLNFGPDEPYGGGVPGVDFEPADPASTGQVMKLVVKAGTSPDTTTPPLDLQLPAPTPLGAEGVTRALSLNEEESQTVRVVEDGAGNIVLDCQDPSAVPFGPTAALLGTLENEAGNPLLWTDPITETPALDTIEVWEIHNFTEDAHPIHVHLVQFEIVGREPFGGGASVAGSNQPLPGETGFKDTVIAYPGEITRIKARFDKEGIFAWHCHIVEHEDNEMMRPFTVGNPPLPGNVR